MTASCNAGFTYNLELILEPRLLLDSQVAAVVKKHFLTPPAPGKANMIFLWDMDLVGYCNALSAGCILKPFTVETKASIERGCNAPQWEHLTPALHLSQRSDLLNILDMLQIYIFVCGCESGSRLREREREVR